MGAVSTTHGNAIAIIIILLILALTTISSSSSSSEAKAPAPAPTPTPWPPQFHAVMIMNYSGILQIIDLWYDWPNGRNLNIIQHQLGKLLYDLQWNNRTYFFYSTQEEECSSGQLEVGILRPNWMDGATYLGQRKLDGFDCNVWEKADFIRYYEDVATQRPVHWVFYTGREAHVMSYEVGAVLEDSRWQAPFYCFHDNNKTHLPLLLGAAAAASPFSF